MRELGYGNKKYAPDLTTFALEGTSGVIGTVASIIAGPVRILLRVMHNVMIMPANLLLSYANSLTIVSAALLIVGIVDLMFYRKWPLVVSQCVVLLIAYVLKAKAKKSVLLSEEKKEVEIDFVAVEELCNDIYTELDKVIEEVN